MKGVPIMTKAAIRKTFALVILGHALNLVLCTVPSLGEETDQQLLQFNDYS